MLRLNQYTSTASYVHAICLHKCTGYETSTDEEIVTAFLDFWTSYSSNYDYDSNTCASSCNLYLRVRHLLQL